MKRSKKYIFGRIHDRYALFCGVLADNHGRGRQIRIGRVPQSEYTMDVILSFMKLASKVGGLDEEDPALLRRF